MGIIINNDDVVTALQAANILKVHFSTIYRWVDSGKITGIKLGGILFIPKSEVERKLNEKAADKAAA